VALGGLYVPSTSSAWKVSGSPVHVLELQPSKRLCCCSPLGELHLKQTVNSNTKINYEHEYNWTVWNKCEGLFPVGRLGHLGC